MSRWAQPEPERDLTARACASTYAIMGGVWFLLLGILLHAALRGVKGASQMAALLGGILVFVLGWVASFRICISGNLFSYRSLFGGTRTIQLGEIESAEIKIGMKEKFGPVLQTDTLAGSLHRQAAH